MELLGPHKDHLRLAREAADELKSHLTRLNMSLEKDIAKRKEMSQYGEEAGLSKEEMRKEKEEIAFLESIYPVQLYRQISRWIKTQEKLKDGPPRKRRRRRNRPS